MTRKLSSCAALGAFFVLSAGYSHQAFAEQRSKLPSHVAAWLSDAKKIGGADTSKTITLSVFLGLHNQDDLTRLIKAQTTPGEPEYGRYLTAAEFHARFAPSAEDAAAVQKSLRALGFKIGNTSQSNAFIEFSGTVGQVKSAFRVSQNLYSFQGKVLRANAEEPVLPASLKGLVTAIVGLDESGKLIHPFHHWTNEEAETARTRTLKANALSVSPSLGLPIPANNPSPYCSTYYGDNVATLTTQPSPYFSKLPWLLCSYTPQQMRTAYGADKSTRDGKGITVAIVDAYKSPTALYDVNRFSKHYNLPALVSGTTFQEIYNGNLDTVSADDVCAPQGWFGEISLDIDAVHTMAPGANILYSGGLSCSNVDLDAALYTVIDGTASVAGPLADIVSNSYGFDGEPLSPAEQAVDTAIFQQASSEGVSVLFSSGDNGDNALNIGFSDGDWPATSPYVTAVGGTSLGLQNSSGSKSEWGWGTFRAYLTGALVKSASSVQDTGVGSYSFYSGAGGGPSIYWLQPDYQAGIVPLALATASYDLAGNKYVLSPPARVVPDVSMDADPYTGFLIGESYLIAGDPITDDGCVPYSATTEYCELGIGGTSLASPLMAGTLALVDQERKANGLSNIGLANAKLYGLTVGAAGSKTTPLVDVLPPRVPTAMLRGYKSDLTRVRLITVNSVPAPYGPLCKSGSVCEGQDSWTLQTKKGYDDVTGLGTPNIPAFVTALGK